MLNVSQYTQISYHLWNTSFFNLFLIQQQKKMGRNWNEQEDNMLRELIAQYGKQWSVIASHIPNRTATQIAARWEKCINPKLTKGPFNAEEDRLIIEFVEEFGCHAWPKITSVLPHRTPKQCRERWFNNLDPTVT